MSSSLKGENHLTIWRMNGPLDISYLHHFPIDGVVNDRSRIEMGERYVVAILRDGEAASRRLIHFVSTETLLKERSMRSVSARLGYGRNPVEHLDTENTYTWKINSKFLVTILKNVVQIFPLESLNSCEEGKLVPSIHFFKVSQLPS